MELEAGVLVSPAADVPLIDGDIVSAIRDLASRGVGSKAIAKQLGVARNTVRRYRREPVGAGVQVRQAEREAVGRRSPDRASQRRRWQCGRRATPSG